MGSRRKSIDKKVGSKLDPSSAFFEVVERAYSAFDGPKPTDLGVCRNCCMYPEIEADFLNPDIRNLPLAYVRDWFFAAADQPVNKAIWRHLLPRVLEILAVGEEDPADVGLEVSLSRFPTGDAAQWNATQTEVLWRFADLYLDRQKTNTRDYLDDVLCMFGLAGYELQRLLARLDLWSDSELAWKLYNDWAHPFGGGSIWITAFWEAPLNSEVFAWYTSQRLYDRMFQFGLDDATPREIARKALDVSDMIETHADWARQGAT